MRVMKAPEVAEMLGVSTARIYTLTRQGLIPTIRMGRLIRFSEERVRAWIDDGGSGLPGGWRRTEE